MKQIAAIILALGICIGPVSAQEDETEIQDGFDLMEEGAKMLMRGLMSEFEPAIDELRDSLDDMAPILKDFAAQMGPAFATLLSQVDDLRYYQAPEILDNGDIIIRRKPDAPIWIPEPDADGIEL